MRRYSQSFQLRKSLRFRGASPTEKKHQSANAPARVLTEDEVERRDRSLCETILLRQFDKALDLIEQKRGLKYIDPYGRSPLHIAVDAKAPGAVIHALLQAGLDPNLRDLNFRRSPLHLAVLNSCPQEIFVTLLNDPRIEPDLGDKFDLPALSYVLRVDLPLDLIQTMISLGCTINKTTICRDAVSGGKSYKLIAMLLRMGATPTKQLLGSALAHKVRNGDETAFVLYKAMTMVPLCTMNVRKFKPDGTPKVLLPSDLWRSVMFALYGNIAPFYQYDS